MGQCLFIHAKVIIVIFFLLSLVRRDPSSCTYPIEPWLLIDFNKRYHRGRCLARRNALYQSKPDGMASSRSAPPIPPISGPFAKPHWLNRASTTRHDEGSTENHSANARRPQFTNSPMPSQAPVLPRVCEYSEAHGPHHPWPSFEPVISCLSSSLFLLSFRVFFHLCVFVPRAVVSILGRDWSRVLGRGPKPTYARKGGPSPLLMGRPTGPRPTAKQELSRWGKAGTFRAAIAGAFLRSRKKEKKNSSSTSEGRRMAGIRSELARCDRSRLFYRPLPQPFLSSYMVFFRNTNLVIAFSAGSLGVLLTVHQGIAGGVRIAAEPAPHRVHVGIHLSNRQN